MRTKNSTRRQRQGVIRVGSARPLPMVAIEAVVNSCHDDLKLLLMHTLDRKGSRKEIK